MKTFETSSAARGPTGGCGAMYLALSEKCERICIFYIQQTRNVVSCILTCLRLAIGPTVNGGLIHRVYIFSFYHYIPARHCGFLFLVSIFSVLSKKIICVFSFMPQRFFFFFAHTRFVRIFLHTYIANSHIPTCLMWITFLFILHFYTNTPSPVIIYIGDGWFHNNVSNCNLIN